MIKQFTAEEKKRSHRFLERGDKVYHLNSPNTFGCVLAVYDHWVWVRWDSAANNKGCWQPDTEDGSALVYVGDYEE